MNDDLTGAVWRKSTRSNGDANCVETCVTGDGGRAVRDSKDKSGPILRFAGDEWRAFIVGAKCGGFDAS
ncbi:DUF397 domain-containing protein [Embleya sp. MST-111070]|uniref:DUF397 domain-containing protein n=1 Tax=Embleya sp. MST-111070 TaxID=3398231 RepID=UPI003F737E20